MNRQRTKQNGEQPDFDERIAQQSAQQMATEMGSRKVAERKQNPDFLDKLEQVGVDTDEFPWIEQVYGPVFADAHFVGNRSAQFERISRWGNKALAEQIIEEGNPGRLCTGSLLEKAHQLGKQPEKREKHPPTPWTVDDRRAIRGGAEAATNYQSNAIQSKGLESVTTATTVAKTEKQEQEQSWREKAASSLR